MSSLIVLKYKFTVVSLHKNKKKCQVTCRKGLFHYVTSGSNKAHHVEKGSRVQSRMQLWSNQPIDNSNISQSDSKIHNTLR